MKEDLEFIFFRTKDLWLEYFNNKNLFITGGTGFFGSWLLETIRWVNENTELNVSATILTRDFKKFQKKAPQLANYKMFKFIEGDIRSFNFIEENYDYLFHFATTRAEETFKGEDELRKFETIAYGTKRVLEFAKLRGIKKVLITSSGAIYGKDDKIDKIPENYYIAPNPLDISLALGHGKRVAEFYCSYFCKKFDIDIKIARCFSFIGPYLPLNIHYAIGNFIKNALNNEPIVIKGDGSQIRGYLYSADLIIWLLTILIKGKKCEPYNVGSDKGISIKDLAKLILKLCQKKLEIIIKNKNNISPANKIYLPSIDKARKELNLDVFTPLEDAIIKTYKFYLNS